MSARRREKLLFQRGSKSFEILLWKGGNKELFKWIERDLGYQRWIFVSSGELEWILACLKTAAGMNSYHNVIPSEDGSLRTFIIHNGERRLMVIKKEGRGRPRAVMVPEGEGNDWDSISELLDAFLHPPQETRQAISYADVVRKVDFPAGRFTFLMEGDKECPVVRVLKEDNRARVSFLERCLVVELVSNDG